MIELTLTKAYTNSNKISLNPSHIVSMTYREDHKCVAIYVTNDSDDSWEVTETREQIQEMILIDEFAKVAMGAFLSSPSFDHAVTMDMVARDAYSQAYAMIEARRELKK